jgi:hypothetical protein
MMPPDAVEVRMRNEFVVGLDDSPSSKAALNWAAEQARSTVPCCEQCTCLTGRTGSAPPVSRAGELHGCELRGARGFLSAIDYRGVRRYIASSRMDLAVRK